MSFAKTRDCTMIYNDGICLSFSFYRLLPFFHSHKLSMELTVGKKSPCFQAVTLHNFPSIPRYSTPDVDFVGGAFTARAVNNLRRLQHELLIEIKHSPA